MPETQAPPAESPKPSIPLAVAAAGLPEDIRPIFQRLGRELLAQTGNSSWRLFIGQYEHTRERERVAEAIENLLPGSRRVTAQSETHPDWLTLEAELTQTAVAATGAAVQVFGLEHWLDPLQHDLSATRLRAANLRREAFARSAPAAIVFWLREAQIRDWADAAPDLWSWRSGVHDFRSSEQAKPPLFEFPLPYSTVSEIDNRSADERRSRIEELRAYLNSTAQQPDSQLRIHLYDEWADLLSSLGDLDGALALRRSTLIPMCQRSGNRREAAFNLAKVTDILYVQGDLDEALRIRRDELIPEFERMGDERGAAIIRGRIADILQTRGQLDEALRIRMDDLLPTYKQLGDLRSVAATSGKVADILQARGQLEQALHIREKEELPVFKQLKDMRSAATTLGKIADILQDLGRVDEAIHLLQEEALPIFENLGDLREAAVTSGRIADILMDLGQFDEASLILEKDLLPSFERLGDKRSTAVTKGKIADIFQARGQLRESLRVHLEEELPIFERLGDIRAISATRFRIALIRLKLGDHKVSQEIFTAILDDLTSAWRAVQQLQAPDGISAVGTLLANVLISTKSFDQARDVLDLVAHAQTILGDKAGLTRTANLLRQIQDQSITSTEGTPK